MTRHALARPTSHPARHPKAAAFASIARGLGLAVAALAALALAITIAAVARAGTVGLESHSPKAPPALDARADGVRISRTATCCPKPGAVRAPDPAAVRSGMASTARIVARPAVATATAPRDAKADRAAEGDVRNQRAVLAAREPGKDKPAVAKDARRSGALEDDSRDVLGDLGRELRDLGRWLTEHDWE